MAGRKSLILCVHAHQPVGNFDSVFLEAYEKAYRPFFEILESHPLVPVSCHLSGSLIDWLERKRPAFLRTLRKMSERGQLEFLGGAYYEPIYGAVPPGDLAGQMRLARDKSLELFGQEPRGAWLTERVWDPELVGLLSRAGARYTVLDDFHLEKAGLEAPVTGYYRARHGDCSVDVFASSQPLRYLIPFGSPEEVLRYLESLPISPEDAVVFADDGEKFGLWPRTFGRVYEDRWLDRMLTLLENDRSITLYTLGGFHEGHEAKGAVEIPHASYREMMEWSGGSFYNFFKKYPESGYMRDRVWNVSSALARVSTGNGAAPDLQRARRALYRAQCNCTYWHGVFGGLYLHHLRSAVFENLIEAETLIYEHPGNESAPLPSIATERLDSGERWRIRQTKLVSYFNPGYGAALEELDYLPKTVNLMCNLRRRKEFYHDTVLKKMGGFSIHSILGQKEKGLDRHLHYDSAMRMSFMDHFLELSVTAEDLRRSHTKEIGDFIGASYEGRAVGTSLTAPLLEFRREGALLMEGQPKPLILIKRVSSQGDSSVRVSYCLRNAGPEEIRFVFGVEFNFSIYDPSAAKGFFETGVRSWDFRDAWREITVCLSTSEPVDVAAASVETVSGSESGLEKTYQGLCVMLQRNVSLAPLAETEQGFELSIHDGYQQADSN